jgi:hypothetical protein
VTSSAYTLAPAPPAHPRSGGWLFPIDEGQQLRIADDEAGTLWWPTAEEAERAAKEREMARADEERARAERLAERLRQLGIEP